MPAPTPETKIQRSGTAAIIGRANVGKSTLLNAALRERLAIVTPTPQTTRDRILGVVRHGNAQIALLDTPGLHKPQSRLGRRMNATARDAIAGADAMVFVAAVPPHPKGVLTPHPGDLTLLQDLGADIPALLVINKIDLIKRKEDLLPLLEAYAKVRDWAAVIPISARKENGIPSVLDEPEQLLPTRNAVYDEDFLTDRPLRFFAAEFVREQVMLATREEVPHSVAVSVERFEELPDIVHIDAIIYCMRTGHRAIIVGKGGERMRDIGIAARQRIEALLEKRVNLKLWVNVREGWNESQGALVELGYSPAHSRGDSET